MTDASELLRRSFEDYDRNVKPVIAKLAAEGWSPAPHSFCHPLVWLHKDGAWGLSGFCSVKGPKDGTPDYGHHDPGAYSWTGDRIDTTQKLLEWLRHLCGKNWFTTDHVEQMILLFGTLHPGTLKDGVPC